MIASSSKNSVCLRDLAKTLLFFAIAFSGIFQISQHAAADAVQAVKDDRVLILLDDEDSLSPDDRVFSLDQDGKKKGIIKIEKVKGNKAFGRIQKGTVQKDMLIEHARGAPKTATAKSEKQKKSRSKGDHPLSIGFLTGVGMDSMTVKLANAAAVVVEELGMSGTGYSAKAMIDYNLMSYLGVRLTGGIEQMSVTGTSTNLVCDGGTACKTDITYFTLDAWARYAFIDKSTKVWAGVGAGIWLPSSKTTNTLDGSSIGTTSAIYIGGGADFALSDTSFIPVQVDYSMLPASDQVTASVIDIRIGLAWRY